MKPKCIILKAVNNYKMNYKALMKSVNITTSNRSRKKMWKEKGSSSMYKFLHKKITKGFFKSLRHVLRVISDINGK